MSQSTPPCLKQQELIKAVQKHLMRLAELSHATAEALSSGDYTRSMELDEETEHELGAKERAMGALREHRREHGC